MRLTHQQQILSQRRVVHTCVPAAVGAPYGYAQFLQLADASCAEAVPAHERLRCPVSQIVPLKQRQ